MDQFTFQQSADLNLLPKGLIWMLVFLVILIIAAILLKHFVDKRRRTQIFLKNRDVSRIVRNLSGLDFEVWVQQLFLSLGAKVTLTPQQGDHGIDLIVEYQNQKIAVQCKKYYGDKKVGEPFLRDLYGVKHSGGFDKALLITTGNFSYEALEWAKGKKDLVLINAKLLERIILNREVLKQLLF